jgi:4-amino-4-deoxy-L-arabinose transferase-like glycosyltransferase
MINFIQKRPIISWSIIALIIYVPFLGSTHLFDWDEVNFAESAREMIVSGDYLSVQINFEPFWEKPPLFMWMQALSFHLFGIFTDHPFVSMEFAARFPNALVGLFTLISLFLIGRKHFSAQFGHLWAFSYLAALTPHLYASSGIIDPLFNLFIFLGIYFFIRFKQSASLKWAAISGIAIGLGMLTKGPVALLLWGLTLLVYGFFQRKEIKNWGALFLGASLSAFISTLLFVSWYGLIALKFGFGIIEDFFSYQIRLLTTGDAGHGQPFYYHFFVLLLGCFPISIWAGARLFRRKKSGGYLYDEHQQDFSKWMKILFWVVLILFSIVKTKIIHYSSMCWIPLTFFSAEVLYEWSKEFWVWKKSYTITSLIVGTLFALILILLPFIGLNSSWIAPKIADVFVRGNLEAPVYWTGLEFFVGALFFVAIVYVFTRKGIVKISLIYLLMSASIGVIMAMSAILLPKVEAYTQRTPIDFYESKVGQKVYIETLGFKSFAHLLYFQKPGKSKTGSELLEKGAGTTPIFFVLKVDAENKFKYHPNLILMKEENGFMFYKRK